MSRERSALTGMSQKGISRGKAGNNTIGKALIRALVILITIGFLYAFLVVFRLIHQYIFELVFLGTIALVMVIVVSLLPKPEKG
jgi:hypothetical protein